MHIKRILTPLLLLSFATGLYSPIKATDEPIQQSNEATAARINILLKVGNEDIEPDQDEHMSAVGIGNIVAVTIVTSAQQAQSIQERIDIIDKLIKNSF